METIWNTDDTENVTARLRAMREIESEAEIESEQSVVRWRDLAVRDNHALYLLMLVADDLLAKRKRGEVAGLVALEMQAALNAMVSS